MTEYTVDACCADGSGDRQPLQLKVLRTSVGPADGASQDGGDSGEVVVTKDALLIRCGDSRILQVSLFRLLRPAVPCLSSVTAAIFCSCTWSCCYNRSGVLYA